GKKHSKSVDNESEQIYSNDIRRTRHSRAGATSPRQPPRTGERRWKAGERYGERAWPRCSLQAGWRRWGGGGGLARRRGGDGGGGREGATRPPPPLQCVQDWPVEAACAVGFCGWQGDGLETVAEVEEFFARVCFEIDQRLGEPAACRWFLNWFDETPRDDMR